MTETKQCFNCKKVKPISEFQRDKTRGFRNRCKYCVAEIRFKKKNPNQEFLYKPRKSKETKRKITLDTFHQIAKEIHADKYDYDLVNFTSTKDIIDIKCKIHGIFKQRVSVHIFDKCGCPQCGKTLQGANKIKTTECFIQESNFLFGNLYDYSLVQYINSHKQVNIKCKEHGLFAMMPYAHLSGQGCPKCGLENRNSPLKKTTEEFIQEAKQKWDNLYNYDITKYVNKYTKLYYKCEKHGIVEQMPKQHLKTGCTLCAMEKYTSAAEEEIKNFISEIYQGDIEQHNRNILYGKEIDIYLPKLKMGFEYHGLYWHSEEYLSKNYHLNKYNLANKVGIRLIQIFENEWRDKQEIVKSRIKSLLNLNKRIYARKTQIILLDKSDKNSFLEKTHIQGKDNSSIAFGLILNDELIACMTFGKPRFSKNYNYELIRYSSALGINIIGGAGKLFKHFQRHYSGSIVSYADKRWSNGNLYKQLGFTLSGETNPGYFYCLGNNILSRVKCQKHKLKQMEHYSDNLSEYEIMQLNGYYRVWDAGHFRFELN